MIKEVKTYKLLCDECEEETDVFHLMTSKCIADIFDMISVRQDRINDMVWWKLLRNGWIVIYERYDSDLDVTTRVHCPNCIEATEDILCVPMFPGNY
jgi:hypothetical protein